LTPSQGKAKPRYLFLDNWVLSRYNTEKKAEALSAFIDHGQYTILTDGFAMLELYNPGWETVQGKDRCARAAALFSHHPCHIVHPVDLWKAEILHFPDQLEELPVRLSLDTLKPHAEEALVRYLRGDPLYGERGVDIRGYLPPYNRFKQSWLQDAENIIETACTQGVLTRDSKGRHINLESRKEKFLQTLDLRLFNPEELTALGSNLIPLLDGGSSRLAAVRFTSLLFWYAYIDTEKGYQPKKGGSDLGDFQQASFIPYCAAFTLDKAMFRLAKRVLAETKYPCELLGPKELEARLAT
jgi:hypothetical protein